MGAKAMASGAKGWGQVANATTLGAKALVPGRACATRLRVSRANARLAMASRRAHGRGSARDTEELSPVERAGRKALVF
jgi:hypothetical protein